MKNRPTEILDCKGREIIEGDTVVSPKKIIYTVFYSPSRGGFALRTKNVWTPEKKEFVYRSLNKKTGNKMEII